MKKSILILILSCFNISCEPDDICLSSLPDTPKLIVGFFDQSTGLKKEVPNLKVQGFNNNNIYIFQTTDSLSIPLKNLDKITNYSFTKDFDENVDNSGNSDNVIINYQHNHMYVSRACGYVSNYNLDQIVIENDNLNWIVRTEIINSEIKEEKSIHVKIFH
ncbi:MAG: DUF6452 family protein [Bacteroidetes bacterium]|mgnify:FL=1|nr:DUF6452 family protein [Bacteroidota bacterium]MDA1019539.1 DUF6452 family protein [Bacteroidota bacterium]